jgi:hypothetical protein
LRDEWLWKRFSNSVKKERIFARSHREGTLGDSGNVDDPKAPASRVIDRRDKDGAKSVRLLGALNRRQPIGKDSHDVCVSNRADGCHGAQIGKCAQNSVRAPQNTSRKGLQAVKPLSPRMGCVKFGQILQQRECKCA